MHCLLPIKKFLSHLPFQVDYFKAEESQVEIAEVF